MFVRVSTNVRKSFVGERLVDFLFHEATAQGYALVSDNTNVLVNDDSHEVRFSLLLDEMCYLRSNSQCYILMV